jgi:hypothetical protein
MHPAVTIAISAWRRRRAGVSQGAQGASHKIASPSKAEPMPMIWHDVARKSPHWESILDVLHFATLTVHVSGLGVSIGSGSPPHRLHPRDGKYIPFLKYLMVPPIR